MAEPVHKATALHYCWGDGCDGWHLVQSAGLSVIEESMPPGTCERRHAHQHARQFFYVLSGALTLEVDGTRYTLEQRQGLEIDPGVAHQALNLGEDAVTFLVTSQPPSHGDRIDV